MGQMVNYGCQNMVDPIRRVLIKHPKDAYQNQHEVNSNSKQLNYIGIPDYDKSCNQYDTFVELIQSAGAEIHFLPANKSTSLDSVYTHDPCVVSSDGVIPVSYTHLTLPTKRIV